MARETAVSYELVRKACLVLLDRGATPSRPAVQELLATPEYLGRKGSNSVVQGFVTQFRRDMSTAMDAPIRTVEGIDEEYVAVLDKALVELVEISRKFADATYAERLAAVDRREAEAALAIEQARKETADALRALERAEGARDQIALERDQLTNALQAGEARLADTRQLLATAEAQREELSAQLEHAHAQIDADQRQLEEEKMAHERDREASRAEREVIAERYQTQLNTALASHQEALDRQERLASEERARIMTQLDQARQEVKTEREALTSNRLQWSAERERLLTELTTLRVTVATNDKARQAAVDQVEARTRELLALTTEIAQSRELLAWQSANCDALKAEVEDLRTRLLQAGTAGEQPDAKTRLGTDAPPGTNAD
jgi:chromosome segregation ATPase